MKAVQYSSYGAPEVIEVTEAPKPSPVSGQVLVKVHAASINPFDYKLRRGYMKDFLPLSFPVTLGGDFSGTVEEVSHDVSQFKKGDEVYGQALIVNSGSGSFAGFAVTKVSTIARKPKNISFVEASALPLTGASAVQALEDHIKLKKGQNILIHGGAGGIGTVAIQLAKALGAYVATTVSTEDIEYAKSLGADVVIDYKKEHFEEKLSNFDAVYDTVGGQVTDISFRILKRGGVIVSMVGQPSEELAKQYGVKAVAQNTRVNTERLNRLTQLVQSGKVKIHIDKIFPLEQAKDAFVYQETGHPNGKVVVEIG